MHTVFSRLIIAPLKVCVKNYVARLVVQSSRLQGSSQSQVSCPKSKVGSWFKVVQSSKFKVQSCRVARLQGSSQSKVAFYAIRNTPHASRLTFHAPTIRYSLPPSHLHTFSLSPPCSLLLALHSHCIIDSLCIFNYNRHVSAFLRVKCLPVTASGEHCGVPQDGRKGQETRKGALVPCRVFSSILGV